MQKLTNEKARELLKELQYAKVQMGGQLSIRDEYFKQALERVVAGAPEGWRLVPVKPTDEMCKAGYQARDKWNSMQCDNQREMYYSFSEPRYKAMVAAAPEAPL